MTPMRIIYADSVFALNFAADYLLLLAAGKICSVPLHRWRMALGALWGGVYALLSILFPPIFALATAKILAGAITAAIARAIILLFIPDLSFSAAPVAGT